jgi:general secretion pathway protein N
LKSRKTFLITIALATLIAGLIIEFPARVAYRLAANPHMAVSGIQGSVWSGNAREFSTNGVYLRDISWRIKPWRLFTGKVTYAVTASPVSGFFETEARIGLGGSITLINLTAAVPVAMLERAARIPGVRGQANIKLERLELNDGSTTALDGMINIEGLVIPAVDRSSLGGFQIEFFTQRDGIVASVEDTEAVLDLAGSLRINPDKSYAFLGYVVARGNTPEGLASRIKRLPQMDVAGQHELRLEGSY